VIVVAVDFRNVVVQSESPEQGDRVNSRQGLRCRTAKSLVGAKAAGLVGSSRDDEADPRLRPL
jgi:hypothetical protein